MKTFVQSIILVFIILSILLSLPYILKQRDFPLYTNDTNLRTTAISKGLKAIPRTYDKLLEISNSKQNPMTKERILLGKKLFFDKDMSEDKSINCATCHSLSKELDQNTNMLEIKGNNCVKCHLKDESGTDRLATSLGTNSLINPHHLNTMTILNSSLAKFFTWDGEIKSLEQYIDNSIKAKHKFNMNEETLLKRIRSNELYIDEFNANFEEGLTYKNIQKSISSYVKTLLTRSSFDEFLEGKDNAISKEAKNGLMNFMNFGCSGCHTGRSVGGQSVQRFPLRNFASIHDLRPNLGSPPEFKIIDNAFPFENKGDYKGRADTGFFRVPILRNVTKTSPYFHNGAVDKIHTAVEIMGRHQVGINLTDIQIDEIVAFLKTLEGKRVDYKLEEGTK